MQSWTYNSQVHHVTVKDSIDIAYTDEGQGRTLLFIHGLGSNLQAWNKNISDLKSDFRCLALDLPGYGKSSQSVYPSTMSFFSECIQELASALDLDNVVLIGHSMGGQVAIHLALDSPDWLSDLCLMAPAGFETFTAQEAAWMQTVSTPQLFIALTDEQIRKNFEVNFFEFPKDAEFMIQDRLEMKSDSVAYQNYCEMIPRCIQGMLQEPVFDRLSQLSIPTQVFYGKNDLLIPNKYLHSNLTTESVGQAGTAQIPNASLQMIENAGHFVQWDGSDKVNSFIKSEYLVH